MWNGKFTPYLVKHRLDTGDITNHVQIVDAYTEPIEGEEQYVCYYTAGFISGEMEPSQFQIEVDGEEVPREAELIQDFLSQNGF